MSSVQLKDISRGGNYSEEIIEWDQHTYLTIINTKLTPEQRERIIKPQHIFPKQDAVLAVHFHPEHVPLPLIRERLNIMYPHKTAELVIPTQHNTLMHFQGYAGVEIDCYSSGFNRKVQLLLHFKETRVAHAHILKNMIAHTFTYRSRQLHELIATIVDPSLDDRFQEAVLETGAHKELIRFIKTMTKKFQILLEQNESITPPEVIKNKLLRDYFDALRVNFDDGMINRAQILIKKAKQIMKDNFPMEYFYRVEEVIEEVRALNGCIVIPHPEQFWPILLADYDVDGYEVWNPQSQEYTEFLITVLNRHNKSRKGREKPILIFMGDDTHMGEKLKDPAGQDPAKASREIGYQPAWDDMNIQKSLIMSNADCRSVIDEYKSRLA